MLTDTAAALPVVYSIIKDRELKVAINALDPEQRVEVHDAIDELQDNPRPAGHEATAVPEMLRWVVETTDPNFSLLYYVDDDEKKVIVIEIKEAHFSKSSVSKKKAVPQVDRARLRQTLKDSFDLSELKTIAFDLGIDYQDLPAATQGDLARELVARCERRNRVPELVAKIEEMYPDITW